MNPALLQKGSNSFRTDSEIKDHEGRADVNIYIMYMRGTSHVSGSPVLLFFCWWYSLLESHWICGSNEFSNYGYVSVDIRKKRKVWFKYRDMYCSCTDPERFVRGGPTLTKVF